MSRIHELTVPRFLHEQLGIPAGQRLQLVAHEDRIVLILLRVAAELRGFLRGMNSDFDREVDRL